MLSQKQLAKAIRHPIRTLKLMNRRYLHLGIGEAHEEINTLRGWGYGRLKRVPARDVFPELASTDVSLVNVFERTNNMSATVYELTVLCSIVRSIRAKRVLEIGTFDGGTTVNLAANIEEGGNVVTVDLPENFSGYAKDVAQFNDNASDKHIVGRQYLNSSYTPRITQLRRDSATLSAADFDFHFDVVFIDGCHDYAYVQSDTELALSVLAPSGVLVWHDYGMIEDVSRYVDEFSEVHPVCAISGTRLAIHRRSA